MKRIVAGGGEWEFNLPIKVGDIITCIAKLVDIYEREGRAGKMLFLTTETIITNQKGEVAAKGKGIIINF